MAPESVENTETVAAGQAGAAEMAAEPSVPQDEESVAPVTQPEAKDCPADEENGAVEPEEGKHVPVSTRRPRSSRGSKKSWITKRTSTVANWKL